MDSIILYTKEECSLCEHLKEDLASIQDEYPHQLIEVDITKDEQLWFAYRYKIPVLEIGHKKLFAPITVAQLKDTLENR